MRQMDMRYLLIIILLAVFPSLANTEQQSTLLVNFQLQPNICITREVGDSCAMTVKVNWQTSDPVNLCLQQNDKQIKCWQQQQQVQESIVIGLQKQSTFTLIDQDKQTLLAKQIVKINYQTTKRFRRRLRSEWSIF